MASTLHKSSILQPGISESDSLLLALFFAAVIHIFILLGINFTIPKQEKINRPIEITLASTPVKKAPKKAKYLAPDNQLASGEKAQKPKPLEQKIPSQGDTQKRQPIQKKNQSESKPKANLKQITQKKSEHKIATTKIKEPSAEKKQTKISSDTLQQQIAQLGAKIRHSQKSAEKTKIKFVNQVSTHQYIAAQYMKDWEAKIERTGNLNFPEVATRKGFSGSLKMDVGINPDGSIYSIKIIRSSGIPALDSAAKRIVRLSAPFAALPAELLQELDVLAIPRVWRFTTESGLTTR